MREGEIADIEEKLADRCVDILIEREFSFAPRFTTDGKEGVLSDYQSSGYRSSLSPPSVQYIIGYPTG
jgi:hypothetical protein